MIIYKIAKKDFPIVEAKKGEKSGISFGYIPLKEYIKRLLSLGWREKNKKFEDHREFLCPCGKHSQTTSKNPANWEYSWKAKHGDLKRQSPELNFLFSVPFRIPEGFDPKTCSIRKESEEDKEKSIYFNELPEYTNVGYEIKANDEWKNMNDALADYSGENSILFNDGTLHLFKNKVLIRESK
jgi:hypothetical protein